MGVDARGTCATAAATAAKVVTIDGYTPAVGDFIAVKYTLGNTANSPTLNVNGGGAKAIKLGGQNPLGGSGTGAAACTAGGTVVYLWDGEVFNQLGSNDVTDADTTVIVNLIRGPAGAFEVAPTTVQSGNAWRPLLGYTSEGNVVECVTATTSSDAAGERTFTTQPLMLHRNILYYSSDNAAFTAGSASVGNIYEQTNLSVTWRFAIGRYHDLSGTLVGNDVTTGLTRAPLFLGGTLSGSDRFVPSEFSLTMRDTAKVYKRIGFFMAGGSFILEIDQPVYIHVDGAWVRFEPGGTLVEVDEIPAERVPGVIYYTVG